MAIFAIQLRGLSGLKRGETGALCLPPRDAVDFILATQPKEWQELAQHHGARMHRVAGDRSPSAGRTGRIRALFSNRSPTLEEGSCASA